MNSARDTPKSCPLRVGCPIRRSRDQRSLASPPGFSQRAASFIASQCQGIHQMPLFRARSQGTPAPRMIPRITQGSPARRAPPGKPPRTGASPTLSRQRGNPARGRSHEDTSSDGASHRFAPHRTTAPQDSKPMPRPVRLGHIHKSASPFNQHQPRNPGRRRGTCPPGRPGTGTKPGLLRTSAHRSRAQITQSRTWSAISPAVDLGASGGERDRTDDLLLAKQALSQLSYTPRQDRGQDDRDQNNLSLISDLLSSDWWAREDLNLRPHAYQARALTS